ncbi:MAG: endonuclease MutS2, partial [Chloroflexota bacterium]
MNPKHLATLELDKVLQRLAAHAAFSVSRELLLELQPAIEAQMVREGLAETTEARRLVSSRPTLTVGGARDVRGAARRAAVGAALAAPDLLEVAGTLESAAVLRNVLMDDDLYPRLARHGADMAPLPALVCEIADVIDANGEVLDSASPRLAELRVRVRGGRDRVLRRLEAIIVDPNTAEAIQQPIVTERAGRYVLAVKASFRQRIQGIVHDQSESGATLFLEPLAVVDLTNDWRQAQLDEQREVDRLLRELSARVGEQAEALERTVLAIARLDAALARAHYAEALEAVEPAVDDGGELELLAARHPLLTGRVVPQTIRLGAEFTVLVITGPNTGGKTVALKTAGLLALMAQCGLHIPASAGSRVAVYREVLADIGDEQSIEQSLSTFSGHMRTLVQILSVASKRTLVLLDELGAGTDPTEGSALARVILNELLRRGTPTIATTHFSELKTFAH